MVVTIIAGSRDITDPAELRRAVEACGWTITEVVSGAARGVDTLGEAWAQENKIPISQFRANWTQHGKTAGFIRNQSMVDYTKRHGGSLLAIWDGTSKGTKDCIARAQAAGLRVYVYDLSDPNSKLDSFTFDW